MGSYLIFDSMPRLMRSLINDTGFLTNFEMEAKLSTGLAAWPTSLVPNLRSCRLTSTSEGARSDSNPRLAVKDVIKSEMN